MSDSEEEGQYGDSMETGRVARYFLFRNREKQPVRRAQLKTVLDAYREKSVKKRKNPFTEANRVLVESMGLKVVSSDEKSQKYYLVRDKRYPAECDLPFTKLQKKEYGLLTFTFFIVYFKGEDGIELEQLRTNLELHSGLDLDNLDFGKWPDIVTKWTNMEYLKMTKEEDPNDASLHKRMVTLGPRFHVEFGLSVLQRMAKELVYPESVKEEEEEEPEQPAEAAPEAEEEPVATQEQSQRTSSRKRSKRHEVSD